MNDFGHFVTAMPHYYPTLCISLSVSLSSCSEPQNRHLFFVFHKALSVFSYPVSLSVLPSLAHSLSLALNVRWESECGHFLLMQTMCHIHLDANKHTLN